MTARRIVFVVYDDFQCLDLTGPYEVFAKAGPAYECTVVSVSSGLVTASNGLPFHIAHSITTLPPGDIDTLVVVGGGERSSVWHDSVLFDWLALTGARSRRIASVCTGVFLLARAGLVDRQRVTTHW